MTPPLPRLASALVRAWTRAYTWRMDPDDCHARRAEIESDLWESFHDQTRQSDATGAAHLLVRLVLGIPDDLSWRAAHVSIGGFVRAVMLTGTVVMVVGGVWVYNVLRARELPDPPPTARPLLWCPMPPPPPPPPGYRGRR